jgi:hypothetical protein
MLVVAADYRMSPHGFTFCSANDQRFGNAACSRRHGRGNCSVADVKAALTNISREEFAGSRAERGRP